MRQAVSDAFVAFSAHFEGVCGWMYLDVLGLVTTGIGCLIDPISAAMALPWRNQDGTPTSPAIIAAVWNHIKGLQFAKDFGGYWFERASKIRLTDDGIHQVTMRKLHQFEAVLKGRFLQWEEWPADAQLGVLSMAWAMGPNFHYPKFEAAAKAQDWTACTNECHMNDEHNPGLKPRNLANITLFENAARVVANHLDPEVLHYPNRPFWPGLT